MAEYLIFHGSWSSGRDANDPGIVSFKCDGRTVTVRGPRKSVDRWARIMRRSTVIAVTAFHNPEYTLCAFLFANKMCSWTYFTDSIGFREFHHVYDDVAGETETVTIVPRSRDDMWPGRRVRT